MIQLSWLERRNLDLWAWCESCCHSGALAPGPLRARLGDRPVPQVGWALRCSRCGGRQITTRPDWPKSGAVARHGASKPVSGGT